MIVVYYYLCRKRAPLQNEFLCVCFLFLIILMFYSFLWRAFKKGNDKEVDFVEMGKGSGMREKDIDGNDKGK